MSGDPRVVLAGQLYCERQLLDYRQAWRAALDVLGADAGHPPPDLALIEAAVLQHQLLVGGERYRARLRHLRASAVAAMQAFNPFEPRLVGAVASGAVHDGHRVQLHLFSDPDEAVDIHCHEHGIDFQLDERRYRYPDGREARVPLLRFEAGAIGVDLAVFPLSGLRRPPLSALTGRPVQRLRIEAVRELPLPTMTI